MRALPRDAPMKVGMVNNFINTIYKVFLYTTEERLEYQAVSQPAYNDGMLSFVTPTGKMIRTSLPFLFLEEKETEVRELSR